MIKSPINYMGSKRRLLKQILPLFPANIHTFYDLFAGGGVVSLNTKAKYHVWNDLNKPLVDMFRDLSTLDEEQQFALYKNPLEMLHREGFEELRTEYNQGQYQGLDKSIVLYELIISSFNGLARFNKKNQYNMPWNSRLTKNYYKGKLRTLVAYIDTVKDGYTFISKSYDEVIDLDRVNKNDFVYLDPPYTQTSAPYNDGSRSLGWTVDDDKKLLGYLDSLNDLGIKFAMSNILSYRGEDNQILVDWLDQHKDIKAIHLNMDYHTSTYHTKPNKSDEVLIVNY